MRSRDYEEFVESLNASGARYLIVGAHAVAFHARPRATKDFDLFIEPIPANAERVLDAIRSFLGSDLGLTAGRPAFAGARLPNRTPAEAGVAYGVRCPVPESPISTLPPGKYSFHLLDTVAAVSSSAKSSLGYQGFIRASIRMGG